MLHNKIESIFCVNNTDSVGGTLGAQWKLSTLNHKYNLNVTFKKMAILKS